MKPDFWNERYAENSSAYGILPNEFFKEKLDKLSPGSLLLPAEGEGRNAIYALKKGWNVHAFDFSISARQKAMLLAKDQNVRLEYEVVNALTFDSPKTYDLIALIYAHFPSNIRKEVHRRILGFLKPGGKIIFEAFSKAQLGKPSGGPRHLDMLFSIEDIKREFKGLNFDLLEEKHIVLNEGRYHQGDASVLRFTAHRQ
ncbi:class I SAM-dependent methyltransferase [Pareuzebyella sediminis]|uniref:class I SAM-dependent methyltransferase n=1 Tax=Pareuzebyella sediminis TaxID=2607998 RepID=UPI0011F098E7|nr:class I SAM-dependent methyltransferase [Pareuzebyella sediminis]